MEIESLRKSNVKLWVSKSTEKEKFYKVGREFVIDLLSGMAKLAIKYYHGSGCMDFPYRQGERQLTSLILPTLSKMSNGAVMVEYPVKRNRNTKEVKFENASGRLDYWCIYKDFSFAIEVKHSFDAFKTSKTCMKDIDKWRYLNNGQIVSLKKEIQSEWTDPTKGVIPIGLHFITSYSYSSKPLTEEKRSEIIKQYKKGISTLLDRLQCDVCKKKPTKTTPNIMACWMPIDDMIFPDDYWAFPGLIVMAKLFQPIPLNNR